MFESRISGPGGATIPPVDVAGLRGAVAAVKGILAQVAHTHGDHP